jgi:hypothetical protein
MLEQKRLSLLHGIIIVYRDPQLRISLDNTGLDAELAKQKANELAAHNEAAQYSGGFVGLSSSWL